MSERLAENNSSLRFQGLNGPIEAPQDPFNVTNNISVNPETLGNDINGSVIPPPPLRTTSQLYQLYPLLDINPENIPECPESTFSTSSQLTEQTSKIPTPYNSSHFGFGQSNDSQHPELPKKTVISKRTPSIGFEDFLEDVPSASDEVERQKSDQSIGQRNESTPSVLESNPPFTSLPNSNGQHDVSGIVRSQSSASCASNSSSLGVSNFTTIDGSNPVPAESTTMVPKLMTLWKGSGKVVIYFVENDGKVVSSTKSLDLIAYKWPPFQGASEYQKGTLGSVAAESTVLLKAEEEWHLGLSKNRSHVVNGLLGEYAFYEGAASQGRYVVVVMSKEVTKEERLRLDVLLKSAASVVDETKNAYEKVENGVETVFESLTQNINSVAKKGTPDLHKRTKWLRKGTGQVVRFGGNLVSKGIHLVTDNMIDKDIPKESNEMQRKLFQAIKSYREAAEKNKITNKIS